MMYRCTECGHIFEDGEQKSCREFHPEVDSMQYERFDGCPLCGGSYESVYKCDDCGNVLSEDELFFGLCKNCVQNRITNKNALSYFKSRGILVNFMMEKVYGSKEPEHYSKSFRRVMEENYEKCDVSGIPGGDSLKPLVVEYIMEDDGEYGIADFAEFMKEAKE